ncbi:hypothetical protein QAD02_012325 [Eretmocerus hayati]|uniref:Uncharacterized protein n=1 Tax=Eretmocerus hayati TaxID=131215 RepID=A0ACC2NZA7_9HYME|nr:hypothetical protein QAD02_012325 [Eretmocerus hayati]
MILTISALTRTSDPENYSRAWHFTGHPAGETQTYWFSRAPRSVGSLSAVIEDYPFMVSLRHAGGHICGGTIISEDTILTAAHCIDNTGITAELLSVKAGSSDVNFLGSWYPVKKLIKHEDYQKPKLESGGNQALDDVALIKLASPIKINNVTTKVVQLLDENDDVQSYKSGTLTGWGYIPAVVKDTSNTTSVQSDGVEPLKKIKTARFPTKLMHVKLDIAPKEKCADLYPSADLRGQFCTYTFGKKVCSGDSGGPLIVNGRQAGIVSWANSACTEDVNSGFFVDVAKYRKWIDKHINTIEKSE